MNPDDALEARLLAAHENADLRGLSCLYRQAAEMAERRGDRDRAAFFLTHAWVFALDAGMAEADVHARRLRAWGRS